MAESLTPTTFRKLDESLAAALDVPWRKQANRLIDRIGKLVEAGNFQAADRLVDEFDLRKAYDSRKKQVRTTGMMSILFGPSQFGVEPEETSFTRAPPQLAVACDQFRARLGTWNEQIRKRVRFLISQRALGQSETPEQDPVGQTVASLFKADLPRSTRVRSFTSFARAPVVGSGTNILRMSSALHTSRLAAWGATTEARLRGIEFFEVNEVLDNRTCPICRTMHKKRFPVRPAQTRLDRTLQITDDRALAVANPWPPQSKAGIANFRKMKRSQLIDAGWDTPPYHPMCRGILKPIPRKSTPSIRAALADARAALAAADAASAVSGILVAGAIAGEVAGVTSARASGSRSTVDGDDLDR